MYPMQCGRRGGTSFNPALYVIQTGKRIRREKKKDYCAYYRFNCNEYYICCGLFFKESYNTR